MATPRVLLIGSEGNMGRRYAAIFRYLGLDYVGYDLVLSGFPPPLVDMRQITHVLIATPIPTHIQYMLWAMQHVKSILCEKPIERNSEAVESMYQISLNRGVECSMVCNWSFILPDTVLRPFSNRISLNYYNTGADGDWDLIQPIYLSRDKLTIQRTSPVYQCQVNGERVTQVDFDSSYVRMIRAWINDPKLLWNMQDALRATRKVEEYLGQTSKTQDGGA